MAAGVFQAVSAQAAGSSSTATTSPAFDSSTGNLLVANGTDADNGTTEAGTPFSDNGSHTWSLGVPINNGSTARFVQRYAKNITGRTGHTVTYTAHATNLFPSVAAAEIIGADPTSPFDQQAVADPAATSNPHSSGTTPTLSSADEIAIAGMTHTGSNSNTFASAQGFTIETSQPNTANMPIVLSSKVLISTGGLQEQYNLTPNDSLGQMAAGIGTYIAAPTTPVYSLEGHAQPSPRF